MNTQEQPTFTFRTYDPSDAASVGYEIQFFKYCAVLTYRNLRSGGIAGTVYRAHPPLDVKEAVWREVNGIDHGHEPDLEAAVDDWLNGEFDPKTGRFYLSCFKCIRKGRAV